MKGKWAVVVSGHPSKETRTKRGADRWTQAAKDAGLDARTERTDKCPKCELHGCPRGSACPEA